MSVALSTGQSLTLWHDVALAISTAASEKARFERYMQGVFPEPGDLDGGTARMHARSDTQDPQSAHTPRRLVPAWQTQRYVRDRGVGWVQ